MPERYCPSALQGTAWDGHEPLSGRNGYKAFLTESQIKRGKYSGGSGETNSQKAHKDYLAYIYADRAPKDFKKAKQALRNAFSPSICHPLSQDEDSLISHRQEDPRRNRRALTCTAFAESVQRVSTSPCEASSTVSPDFMRNNESV